MTQINIFDYVGDFAEDKDKAKFIRTKKINKALENNSVVILNFKGVEIATQSFIHALISEVIRKKSGDVLDKMKFKNCNTAIKTIIQVVVEYMQDVV